MNNLIPDKKYYSTSTVSKSKFIAILIPLSTKEEFGEMTETIKVEFPNASHYCYALRFEGYAKASDDKEPHGTAGRPILLSLTRKKIDKALLVVVRYFGGTKLGASNLLRTYVKSASSVIDEFLKQK